MEGYNPDGLFSIEAEYSKEAWVDMPNNLAVLGMEKDGVFSTLITWGLITFTYSAWENYRAQIAKELGWKTGDVMCDLMGDVRLVRGWIVHNKSTADGRVKELKVLGWPREEGEFEIGSEQMKELQIAINKMSAATAEVIAEKIQTDMGF